MIMIFLYEDIWCNFVAESEAGFTAATAASVAFAGKNRKPKIHRRRVTFVPIQSKFNERWTKNINCWLSNCYRINDQ